MSRWWLCLAPLIGACGSVEAVDPDAATEPDATVAVDADDAPICVVDEFDGDALDPAWTLAAGAVPSYQVAGGAMVITDATTVATPSRPTQPPTVPFSWIYDLDQDLGNQLARRVDLDQGDFFLEAKLGWKSEYDREDHPQGWMGGIALTDAEGHIKLMVGAYDPRVRLGDQGDAGLAAWAAAVRTDNHGSRFHESTDTATQGSIEITLARTGGLVSLAVNGENVVVDTKSPDQLMLPMTADLARLSIVALRNNGANEFGELSIDRVSVCRPRP